MKWRISEVDLTFSVYGPGLWKGTRKRILQWEERPMV